MIRELSAGVGTVGVVLSLGACGPNEVAPHSGQVPGTPLGLSQDPVLVVGERPGDPNHELFAVGAPFLLPGGRVGVPLSGDATIRIYEASGDYVQSLGAEGEGPGEFVRLAGAWARGDTIEAFDPESYRVTRFVPGAAPQTVRLEGVSSAQVVAPGLDDGSWVLYGVREVKETGRDVIEVHRFAPDGGHVGVLEETLGFRRHVFSTGVGPDPISPRAVVRTGGHSVYVAQTLEARIAVHDTRLAEPVTIQWSADGRRSGRDAIEAAKEALGSSGLSGGLSSWHRASFEGLNGDEEASVFWDFLVDGEEFLWVRDYDPVLHAVHAGGLSRTGPGGVWSVLDRTGAKVGDVHMPDDFEPSSIDGDKLLGIRRGAFDVESVRIYQIERSGSREAPLRTR